MNVELAAKTALEHYNSGNFEKSELLCKKILRRQDKNHYILNLLGLIYFKRKDYDSAISYFKKSISINPLYTEGLCNLGLVLMRKKELDEALACFKKASEIKPYMSEAWGNIGSALYQKGLIEDAIEYYKRALKLKPTLAENWLNIGTCLIDIGKPREAIQYLQKAIEIKPDYALAHFNLSFARLVLGDFKRGWYEYMWRWGLEEFQIPQFPQPLWNGSYLEGKTIYIHGEQGFGDTIQFVRYAPLIVERGGRVIIAVQKVLLSLLKSVEGISEIVTEGDPLPQFDVHCPLAGLPLAFETDLNSIPSKVPYISVDRELIKKWAEKLKSARTNLKVGLAWAGSQSHKKDMFRSINLEQFAPLGDLHNIVFYSLQKGRGSEQAKNPPYRMKLIDLMDEVQDFSDTSAIIENLDLVISVDTSVAHLAGALGKPVWTLLPYAPDWRWLLDREDSPWYPTMRLFRQPKMRDWDSVIRRVVEELRALSKGNNLIQISEEKKDERKSIHDEVASSKEAYALYSKVSIKQNDFVRAHYVIRLTDRSICDFSFINGPVVFKPGEGKVIRGLENAVKTMLPYEFKSIQISASDAFGSYDPKLVFIKSKIELPANLQIGQVLQVKQHNGKILSFWIADIRDGMVVLNANHPLAGKDLVLDILLLERGENAVELSDDTKYRSTIEKISRLENPEEAIEAMNQNSYDKSILISVPVFNRKKITQLCLSQIQRYKTSRCFLQVYNDHSTEFDNQFLVEYADEVIQLPNKMGINNLRLYQLRKFIQSDFDFIYLTDNDVIHDPSFIKVLIFLYELGERKFPVCIYNTIHHMQPNVILFKNNFILLKRTSPGVSIFFDKKMVETIIKILDNVGDYQADFNWDYRVIAYLDRPVLTSVTSYLDHFGAGGTHNLDFERDRALNPTKYLLERRESIIDYLTGKNPADMGDLQKII
ncbi:MAG: tetratricopeptide repeat protein [Nitrospirae bacterium]|nr:tetratricopeptide repeat protein [Nitrospirota bacterium]